MRVNLTTQATNSLDPRALTIPISLTIRPSCGVPGDYAYRTDSVALLRMLDNETDLPSSVLQRFESEIRRSFKARLLGVELSERLLEDIGYFID
jgi:hypothetical protein